MIENILVLVDFSEVTRSLITKSLYLGHKFDAKCWLVHVVPPDPDIAGYDVGPQYVRDNRAGQLRTEHSLLLSMKDEFVKAGVRCEAMLVTGVLTNTIDAEIEKLGIDLVVVGSHGRSMIYEILVGSVCEHLIRHSDVPLFVVPVRQSES